MWSNYLPDRDNFQPYNFLSPLDPGCIGFGHQHFSSFEHYLQKLQRFYRIFTYNSSFDDQNISETPYYGVCGNTCFPIGTCFTNINHIKLAYKIFNLKNNILPWLETSRNINYLEIGAGSGFLAQYMFTSGIARKITIVDLPETLMASFSYLRMSLPDVTISINQLHSSAQICLFSPSHLDLIEDQYDLVLNEASFGEMPASVCNEYLKWASRHINTDGILYSENGASRTDVDNGIKKFSDYFLDFFDLLQVLPRSSSPISFLSDSHLRLVLRPRSTPITDTVKTNRGCYLNFLHTCGTLGLENELFEICKLPHDNYSLDTLNISATVKLLYDSYPSFIDFSSVELENACRRYLSIGTSHQARMICKSYLNDQSTPSGIYDENDAWISTVSSDQKRSYAEYMFNKACLVSDQA